MHLPSQLHRIVHLIPALAHLLFPLHAFPHSQWWRRAHALLTSSRTVQNGTQNFVFTSCVQPHAWSIRDLLVLLPCLSPDVTCLVQSSLCMLKQHFVCVGGCGRESYYHGWIVDVSHHSPLSSHCSCCTWQQSSVQGVPCGWSRVSRA